LLTAASSDEYKENDGREPRFRTLTVEEEGRVLQPRKYDSNINNVIAPAPPDEEQRGNVTKSK